MMKKYKPGIGISLAAATLAAGTLIGSYLACRSNEKDILAIQNPRAEELHINGLRNFHMGLSASGVADSSRLELAISDFEKSIELNNDPSKVSTLFALGSANYTMGDWQNTIAAYSAALTINDSLDLHLDVTKGYNDESLELDVIRYQLGHAQLQLGQYDNAFNTAYRGLEIYNNNENLQNLLGITGKTLREYLHRQILETRDPNKIVDLYKRLADIYIKDGVQNPLSLSEVLNCAQEIEKYNPGNPSVSAILGQAHLEFGIYMSGLNQEFDSPYRHYRMAVDNFRNLLINDPKNIIGYRGLGSALYNLGDYNAAKDILKDGLRQYPEDPDLNYYYGNTLLNLGNRKLGLKHFKKACKNEPEDPKFCSKYEELIHGGRE